MGPGRDMQDKPSARVKNIETFEVCTMYMDDDQIPQIYCKIKETLRAFLATNDYLRYKDLVTFHQYNTEEEVFVILIVMTIAQHQQQSHDHHPKIPVAFCIIRFASKKMLKNIKVGKCKRPGQILNHVTLLILEQFSKS